MTNKILASVDNVFIRQKILINLWESNRKIDELNKRAISVDQKSKFKL